MNHTIWLWVGAVGMVVGTLPPLWRLVTDPENRSYYALLAAITGIAAVAYVVMALGLGSLRVGGTELVAARYVDWLLTTPLMVLYLGLLGRCGTRLYAALVGADVVVILGGVAADVLDGLAAAAAFGVATLAFCALVYLLLVTVPRRVALREECVVTFTKLRNLTVVLWSLYPVVWLLSGSGFGLLLPATENVVVVYLDFISKVGFVVMAVNGDRALDALEAVRLDGRTSHAD
ncbi:bacteriorhodopsin [Salinigranum marinum]|uniref:bacteriorhodopsin n=1 Tax=Salinigranum marinum TaxID=1515595 RepID=UPI002989F469|nr:bacteriorhodopsin [Salinigranum marinum]